MYSECFVNGILSLFSDVEDDLPKAAGTLEDANASDVLQLSCFIFYNPHRDIDNREEPVNTILKRLNRAFQEVIILKSWISAIAFFDPASPRSSETVNSMKKQIDDQTGTSPVLLSSTLCKISDAIIPKCS